MLTRTREANAAPTAYGRSADIGNGISKRQNTLPARERHTDPRNREAPHPQDAPAKIAGQNWTAAAARHRDGRMVDVAAAAAAAVSIPLRAA